MSSIRRTIGCAVLAIGIAGLTITPAQAAYRNCFGNGTCETVLTAGGDTSWKTSDGKRVVKLYGYSEVKLTHTEAGPHSASFPNLGFAPHLTSVQYPANPNNPYFDWRVTATLEFPRAGALIASGNGWESAPAQPDLSGVDKLAAGGELQSTWHNGNRLGAVWHFHRPGQQNGRPNSQTIPLGNDPYARGIPGPSLSPADAATTSNPFRSVSLRLTSKVGFEDGTSVAMTAEDNYSG